MKDLYFPVAGIFSLFVSHYFTRYFFLFSFNKFLFSSFNLISKLSTPHSLQVLITHCIFGEYVVYLHILESIQASKLQGTPFKYLAAAFIMNSKFWQTSQQLCLKGILPCSFMNFGLYFQNVLAHIFLVVDASM